MTRKELKRRIRAAWSKYEDAHLRKMLRMRGLELHGLQRAHDILGAPAALAYEIFKKEQKAIQDEFGAAVDAKFLARSAKKRAAAAKAAELDQAQRDVLFYTQRCEQERTRAKALVKYCGVSEDEAALVTRAAEDRTCCLSETPRGATRMTTATVNGVVIDGSLVEPFNPMANAELIRKIVAALRFLDENHAFVGEEDIVLDAATQGSNLNWPDEIHANDMFIVLGTSNGDFQKLIRGGEINGLTNGVVGTTLTAAQKIDLYQYGTTTLRAAIGKDANGQFLIQSQAADTDGHVEIWRFRKNRV